jgi:hypothetical protein
MVYESSIGKVILFGALQRVQQGANLDETWAFGR